MSDAQYSYVFRVTTKAAVSNGLKRTVLADSATEAIEMVTAQSDTDSPRVESVELVSKVMTEPEDTND